MTKKNLILTMMHRMDGAAVRPFFRSLHKTNFTGDVVVFASAINSKTADQLQDWGAQVVSFSFRGKHVANRLAIPWWLWKRIFSSSIPQPAKERLAHAIFHLFYRRHLLYRDYLRAHGEEYDRVFLTDCRDVIFQSNPFDWDYAPGLHLFLEEETNQLGTCWHHIRWISSQFGPDVLQQWKHKTVSCAGTVFGSIASMVEYLDRMIALTMSVKSLRHADGDQGIHNYLLQTASLPEVTIHTNRLGPVMTLGPVAAKSLHFDQRGRVLDDIDRVVPVLHQYDRDPELRSRVMSQLETDNAQTTARRRVPIT